MLSVRFGSHELGLEGMAVEVAAGAFKKRAVLERRASDQVGAQVDIPHAERRQLEEGTALRAEIVELT